MDADASPESSEPPAPTTEAEVTPPANGGLEPPYTAGDFWRVRFFCFSENEEATAFQIGLFGEEEAPIFQAALTPDAQTGEASCDFPLEGLPRADAYRARLLDELPEGWQAHCEDGVRETTIVILP